MDIKFTNVTVITENGLNFQAIVDQKNVVCSVSQEALQDINPQNRADSIKKQFEENQDKLEAIAKSKILKNQIENNFIVISTLDI